MDIESLDIKSLPFVRLSNRGDLPDVSGIYFVVDERGVPVYYIGQAESLKKRWNSHDKMKVFEHYDSIHNPISIHYLKTEGSLNDRVALENQAIKYFVSLMNYQTRRLVYGVTPQNTDDRELNSRSILQRVLSLEYELSVLKNGLAERRGEDQSQVGEHSRYKSQFFAHNNLSGEQLFDDQFMKTPGTANARIERAIAAIRAFNSGLSVADKIAITPTVIQKITGSRIGTIRDMLGGGDDGRPFTELGRSIADYNSSFGFKYHHNRGKDLVPLAEFVRTMPISEASAIN